VVPVAAVINGMTIAFIIHIIIIIIISSSSSISSISSSSISISSSSSIKGKDEGKVHHTTGHDGPELE
jgi:hypothetical protein